MIKFANYFEDNYRYTLYSLVYKKIETTSESNSSTLCINDDIRVEKSSASINCYYKRVITLNPEMEFYLEVEYKIIYDALDKVDISSLTEDEIRESIYSDADVLNELNQVASHMSLIIAQTLNNGNHDPLVLPPRVFVDQPNE